MCRIDRDEPCMQPRAVELAPDLDPLPFVWPTGTRSMFNRGDGQPLMFAPRPEFAQVYAEYEPHMVGPGA